MKAATEYLSSDQDAKRLAVVEALPSKVSDGQLLAVARAAAKTMLVMNPGSALQRAGRCLTLLSGRPTDAALIDFKSLLDPLPTDQRHYWIGTLYTLLLPAKTRRSQATYFTPPYLAEAVIDLAVQAGFDLGTHTVLDPAAGGAAFLSTIVGRKLKAGIAPTDAIRGLHGVEIDAGLARVSRELIADRIGLPVPSDVIETRDALPMRATVTYDLVIANPPYGRISPDDLSNNRWEKVAHSGHVNKYAVFADLSLRFAKPGGIVALIIPSSFRAGPLYDRLRAHMRSEAQVLTIGTVADRDGVFADVAQDVSVIVLRKGQKHYHESPVAFPIITPKGANADPLKCNLPETPTAPWPTPAGNDVNAGGSRLADYGVVAKAGYFVWNREKVRLVTRAKKNAVPLIWAKNVRPGLLCMPAGKDGKKADFVTFKGDSSAIVRGSAAVMQRTTNDKQPRRLVAAMVNPSVVKTWGGFVSENHTIVLTAAKADDLKLAVKLLNTKAADERYRRVSGTASISVTLLRELDLPSPERFRAALKAHANDPETAAREAYLSSEPLKAANE